MNGKFGGILALVMSQAVLGFSLRADSGATAHSAREWAGSYYHSLKGSTISLRLVITPQSRFTLDMGGCFGSNEINRGRVVHRDGALVLEPAMPFAPGSIFDSYILIPKHEDGRRYLNDFVRESDLAWL